MLSGSAGWGIKEGIDQRADWDIHVLLSDEDYLAVSKKYGNDYVIDDREHAPVVFCQIHNKKWLQERLLGKDTAVLYLWIYTRGLFIQDKIDVEPLVSECRKGFLEKLPELQKNFHIQFSVRRLDTASCAGRGIMSGTGVNRGEMVKAALQTFSLIHGEPYPYNKWLAKHVRQLAEDGGRLVELCEQCLFETDFPKIVKLAKDLRDFMESAMEKAVGKERWIHYWWEFNKN